LLVSSALVLKYYYPPEEKAKRNEKAQNDLKEDEKIVSANFLCNG